MKGGALPLRKRTIKYTVRFNEAEHQHFREQAARTGYSGEEYIRHLVAKQNIQPRPVKELENVRRQMSLAGNNINQVAKKVNSTGTVTRKDIQDLLQFLDQVWNAVKRL